MSNKALIFVFSTVSVVFLLIGLVLSWAMGDWGPLIGAGIALVIGGLTAAFTLGICVLAERWFPRG